VVDHVRFSRTNRCGTANATEIFIDGERVGTIRGSARTMDYTVTIRGRTEVGLLSLQDAKRRVRQIYEDL